MKQLLIYIILCTLISSCDSQKERGATIPSLNETYERTDKKPFGGYVAYNHTKLLLGDAYIETITDPFNEAWNKMVKYDNSLPSLYFLVTKNLILRPHEASAMIDYVKEGNDLFISADYIDDVLLNKIDVRVERDSEFVKEVAGLMKETSLKSAVRDSALYNYYYYPFLNSFSGFDEEYTRVLGYNEAGKPNYIVKFLDKGRIYLHAAPRSFGNYFLLKNENHHYLEKILSYLREDLDNIYWDSYYQKRAYRRKSSGNSDSDNDEEKFSSFAVIMRNPPLRAAFWLGLTALLMYVFFNIKRKQRTIREIPPLANNTVVFTETVGRLYLQKKNNKNIAEKMITYFYEYIRNKYFLNTGKINDELIVSLSGKSGMEINETRELFRMIDNVHVSRDINDMQLLALNQKIQNFYKLKN